MGSMAARNTFNLMLLLLLPAVRGSGSSKAVGRTDQSVTLRCHFNVRAHEEPSVCWNRGHVPSMECNNQLIATGVYKGRTETSGSSRYRLLGRLDQGDASLTILNLTEDDAGRYGCRVRVAGWFNDLKRHIDLMVERGVITTASTPTQTGSDVTAHRGSDVTATQLMMRADQASLLQQENTLHLFIGNSLRLCFIVFIPALLTAVVYRVWTLKQSEESSIV